MLTARFKPIPKYKAEFGAVKVVEAHFEVLNASPSQSSQHITPSAGKDGFSEVNISAIAMQEKSIIATKSQQIVEADEGYSGLSKVTVGGYVPDTETKTVNITENGQTLVAKSVAKDGMTVVEVNTDVHPTVEDDTLVFALANASVEGDTITV